MSYYIYYALLSGHKYDINDGGGYSDPYDGREEFEGEEEGDNIHNELREDPLKGVPGSEDLPLAEPISGAK